MVAVTIPDAFTLDADTSVTVIFGLPVNPCAVDAVPVKAPVNVVAVTLVTDIEEGSLALLIVPAKSVAVTIQLKLVAVKMPVTSTLPKTLSSGSPALGLVVVLTPIFDDV